MNERQSERGQLRRLPSITSLDDLLVSPEEPHRGSTIRQERIPKEAPIPAGREYLGLRELAAYSGLSVRKLREHLNDPSHPLPCRRIGGKILVRRVEYDTWAARYRQMGRSDVDRIVSDVMKDLGGRSRWA